MAGTTVWLARHGEVHNPKNVLYGRLPRVDLTSEGRRQAQALADYLRGRPIAAIYSSPMLRARHTADAIASAHPEIGRVHIDSDLLEVRTAWQGEPLAALERIKWDFYNNPRHPDDESLLAIRDRMLKWLGRMLRRHAGSEVVGVSHGDPILILVGTLSGRALDPHHIFPRRTLRPAWCTARASTRPAPARTSSCWCRTRRPPREHADCHRGAGRLGRPGAAVS